MGKKKNPLTFRSTLSNNHDFGLTALDRVAKKEIRKEGGVEGEGESQNSKKMQKQIKWKRKKTHSPFTRCWVVAVTFDNKLTRVEGAKKKERRKREEWKRKENNFFSDKIVNPSVKLKNIYKCLNFSYFLINFFDKDIDFDYF